MFALTDVLDEAGELELLEHYYQALLAARPDLDYSFIELCHDYMIGMLYNISKFAFSAADNKEVWKKNPDAFRAFFKALDTTVERWTLKDFVEQGCEHTDFDPATFTATMTALSDDERFDVLPTHVKEYVVSRDKVTPQVVVPTGMATSGDASWLRWVLWR